MKFIFSILLLFFVIDHLYCQDITPPDTPELQYVSVDPNTNNVTIEWLQSDSVDTKGYVIYRKNINWLPVDTVYGQTIISYTDITSSAGLFSEQYRIAAFDSSNNVSPMTDINRYHNTIYIFPYQVRVDCRDKIKITFNPYVNWDSPVSGYIIYRDIDYSGTFSIVDTAASTSQTYFDTNIVTDHSYCYYVEAFNSAGFKSSSNKTCKLTDLPESIQYVNADYATISDYNLISLSFTADNSSETVSSFKLMQSDQYDGNYSVIQTYDAPFTEKISHSEAIDMKNDIFYFKLAAFNECDEIEKESNVASNIVLKVSHSDTLKHRLSWNMYAEWLDDVSYYDIYKLDENNFPVLLETVYTNESVIDVNSLAYGIEYNEFVINKISGNFCYFIEAVEGSNNPYGIQGKSRSNLACISEAPYIHVPTAFSPDNNGTNDVFRPFVLFASPDSYLFNVYDRWGEIIFTTSDPLQGWNGRIKGHNAKEGTYAYFISFITSENRVLEKKGTFSLLYP